MFKKRDRNEIRVIRHARVRKKISGTPEVPRLSVYRSNKHIQAQIIDDVKGATLVSASTMDPALKGQLDEVDKKGAAKQEGCCQTGGQARCRARCPGRHQDRGFRPRRVYVYRPCGECCRRCP